MLHPRASTADWLDRTAVVGSIACMVHCLALPLLMAALPALSALAELPVSFHIWVLGSAVPAAAIALVHGRTTHGSMLPLALGTLGLLAISSGAFAFDEGVAETTVTVGGSLLLALAHAYNWRLRRGCGG